MSHAEVEVEVQQDVDVTKPSMWLVIFHNDDKTTMDFVIMLLMQLFHKSVEEATEIMLQIHTEGQSTVGRFTHEIAEEKMNTSIRTARAYGYPLNVSIEEEE